MKPIRNLLTLTCVLAMLPHGKLIAASHSDAALIKQDPQANITDVYSFIGADGNGGKVLNVVVHVRPFSEPGDGPFYDRFSDFALYSIHIANPSTGETELTYNFNFSSVTGDLKNPNTIFQYGVGTRIGSIENIGDDAQNYVQTYGVEMERSKSKESLSDMTRIVPPPNVGENVTPHYNDENGVAVSGATTAEELDIYTSQAIYPLPRGYRVFAGPREDGFYADTPAIFDLFASRVLDNNGNLADGLGQDGDGVDGFKGYNVLAYGIQIPLTELQGVTGFPTVGVYASVSRSNRKFNGKGRIKQNGKFIQVNRMGNPLFNELLVGSVDKDLYNRTTPDVDAELFAKYALTSEVAILINTLYGTEFVTTNRTDLRGIFIPDVLRVNTSTEPVRLSGQVGFNRLSFLGGDNTQSGGPSGWPNGRRFGDDVVDIALTAIANGPSYTPPITPVGDNVDSNDQEFHQVFPYSATPHAGTTNRKDP